MQPGTDPKYVRTQVELYLKEENRSRKFGDSKMEMTQIAFATDASATLMREIKTTRKREREVREEDFVQRDAPRKPSSGCPCTLVAVGPGGSSFFVLTEIGRYQL